MKGVLVCGGKGERLFPLTYSLNKHLLPVYNKPMFYYSLSVLLLAGCRTIFIVGNKKDFPYFKKYLKKEKIKKCKFFFVEQKKPDGISSAIKNVLKFFSRDEKGVFLLGDNFFYGNNLIKIIHSAFKNNNCSIFLSHAIDPWNFGTLVKKKGKLLFKEKNNNSKKDSVITGLYILDKKSLNYLKFLKKSKRGEYEIIDLIKLIYEKKKLSVVNLGRGIAWYDMGTFKNINKVSNFVSLIEERQGLKIGNVNNFS